MSTTPCLLVEQDWRLRLDRRLNNESLPPPSMAQGATLGEGRAGGERNMCVGLTGSRESLREPKTNMDDLFPMVANEISLFLGRTE